MLLLAELIDLWNINLSSNNAGPVAIYDPDVCWIFICLFDRFVLYFKGGWVALLMYNYVPRSRPKSLDHSSASVLSPVSVLKHDFFDYDTCTQ